uniref:LIM-domain binding 1b n=1 Tax=Cyprinus carpio TaxID=7962 RepID=A0A8C2JY59_CYPCA
MYSPDGNTEGSDSPQPPPIAVTTPFSRKPGLRRYSDPHACVYRVYSMTDELHALGCSSKSFKLYSPKEPPNGSAFPPFHPGTMLDRDVGRHTPYGNQTDYRIFELNKRLQNWTEDCDNLWWDAFTTEFFEDDAMLTITFCLEDGPKRYTIGRTLIPRYFRSVFEGGATELYYILKHPKESFHNNFVSLDCDQCTMVTQNGKPMFTQVCVEGRLYLEFMFDDMMRIKTWHFSIRQHRELIPRSILAMHAQDPQMLDQLSKNITRCGLSNSTLNYLRLCVILEPMQELMSRHKTYSLSPRDCLKTCLFQKWQRMVAPPAEPARQAPSKRRKRKMSGGSTMSAGGGSNNNSNSKKKSPANSFPLSSQVPVSNQSHVVLHRKHTHTHTHTHIYSTAQKFETLLFLMFLKEVSSAHQACIYLIKNTEKTVIL